jgi:hypothetical protein
MPHTNPARPHPIQLVSRSSGAACARIAREPAQRASRAELQRSDTGARNLPRRPIRKPQRARTSQPPPLAAPTQPPAQTR